MCTSAYLTCKYVDAPSFIMCKDPAFYVLYKEIIDPLMVDDPLVYLGHKKTKANNIVTLM